MVPLTSLGNASYTTGPGSIKRFNMFTTAVIRGSAAQGYSSGQAMEIMEQITRNHLPDNIGLEWSGLSYQEKKAGGQTGLVLTLVFLFVFLFLAAQYESWTVPIAVLLSLPVAALGAYLGVVICGLENDIYFQIGKVPGLLAAPGWSEKPAIAAVMKAKAAKIDGLFPCMALVDINTEQVKKYADVNMWKNGNNYTGNNQIVCWPCAKNGDMVFHLSTHIMGIIGVTDGNNDDVPYQSPSNQTLQATGLCLKDGSEVNLNLTQANLLNEQGIVTGLNFSGGWKSWGNFTGAYPGTTDVKDMFICVRRMFNWQYVTFILTNWQKTDQPITPRLVKTLVDSEQVRLNGLTSRGYLLGASVQFLADENPTTDLLAGIFRIHTKLTPPVPAQDIEDTFEYDVSNFEALFS